MMDGKPGISDIRVRRALCPRLTRDTTTWRPDLIQRRVDRLRGIDFQSVVDPEDLGLDPMVVSPSSPSGGSELRQLLRRIEVRRGSCALDIGCGKGSAIRAMLRLPFARVDGLEIAPELAAIARSNFARLHERRTTIFTADATHFDRYSDYDFLYLYSPFPAAVMAQCMARVVESVAERPRTITILYVNASCHDEIVATGRVTFEPMGRTPYGNEINLYRLT